MKTNYKFIIIYLLTSLLSGPASGGLMDSLNITADNLTIQKDKGTATFSGSVTILFDNLKLKTSKLIVFYQNNNSTDPKIKKIVIPGKLKAIHNCPSEIITADKGVFNNLTKKLTLSGNVHVQKEDNILITDKLVYSSSLKK
jgi:lipopolysaccharide transport protein LptA